MGTLANILLICAIAAFLFSRHQYVKLCVCDILSLAPAAFPFRLSIYLNASAFVRPCWWCFICSICSVPSERYLFYFHNRFLLYYCVICMLYIYVRVCARVYIDVFIYVLLYAKFTAHSVFGMSKSFLA